MAQHCPVSEIKRQLINAAEELKADATKHAKHIVYESFGTDKNKKKKNKKSCDRGSSSGPARYCSAHIRKIYKKCIIGDDEEAEWCVCSRHAENCCRNNACNLCHINTQNSIKTRMINFGEAISNELGGNNNYDDYDKYQRRLLSFMLSHIGSNYPGTAGEQSILRIKVNGEIWLEYYIKLTAFSSLLKTSAPSGYKYKDRISLGRMIRIQAEINKDLVFYITKDKRYSDPEFEEKRPVVNGVGFWDLLKKPKDGDIRNIIHLNNDQAVNVSFGFLINPQNNINSIEVELVCTRHCLSMDHAVLPLWRYPETGTVNYAMNEEIKTNASPSTSLTNNQFEAVSCPTLPPITMIPHQSAFEYQEQPFDTPLAYRASHGVSNSVQQQRHSPLYTNVQQQRYYEYQPLTHKQLPFDDSSTTNMIMMFDDAASINGFFPNTDIMFPDNMSTMNSMFNISADCLWNN